MEGRKTQEKKTCFVQQEIQEQNLTGFLTIVIGSLCIILNSEYFYAWFPALFKRRTNFHAPIGN